MIRLLNTYLDTNFSLVAGQFWGKKTTIFLGGRMLFKNPQEGYRIKGKRPVVYAVMNFT